MVSKNILFINPEAPINNIVDRGMVSEPMGLLYMSSYLMMHNYDVLVYDLQVRMDDENPLADLLSVMDSFRPAIIGITSFTANTDKAYFIAESIRPATDAILVYGGIHATFTAQDLLSRTAYDIYVMGEGENTILELIGAIQKGTDWMEVPGIAFRRDGEVVITKKRDRIPDLDALPPPARNLLDINGYLKLRDSLSIITSRGCPFNCLFCSTSRLHGHRYRAHSPQRVIEEISEVMDNYNPTYISFIDDHFTFDKRRTHDICKLIIENKMEFDWACSSRVDSIDQDLLDLMWLAGCRQMFFGIESGSQKILNTVKKRISLEQIKKTIGKTKEKGIIAYASFIFGLPGEDSETVWETIEFAKALGADKNIFGLLTPFPGTPIGTHPENYGIRIVDHDFSQYNTVFPVIETDQFSSSDLFGYWVEAVKCFSHKVQQLKH